MFKTSHLFIQRENIAVWTSLKNFTFTAKKLKDKHTCSFFKKLV